MPSLIENILSVEQHANEIVAKAQADAKAIAKRADDEIADARERLAAETDARLKTAAAAADERTARELAGVERELDAALAAVDAIAPDTVRSHAARVVEAFTQG